MTDIGNYFRGLGQDLLTEEQRAELRNYVRDNAGSLFQDIVLYVMGRSLRFALENAALGKLGNAQAQALAERTSNLNERVKVLEAKP